VTTRRIAGERYRRTFLHGDPASAALWRAGKGAGGVQACEHRCSDV
jgi:hypothetical protein